METKGVMHLNFKPSTMKVFICNLIFLFTLLNCFAQNGTLDLTFSDDGQFGFMPLPNDVITTEIIASDEGIYAFLTSVNGGADAFVLKMDSYGDIITTYGQDGLLAISNSILYDASLSFDGNSLLLLRSYNAVLQIASYSFAGDIIQNWTDVYIPNLGGFTKMKLDSQGHIYLGTSYFQDPYSYGVVLRLLNDFSIDPAFGVDGLAITPEYGFQYPLLEIDNLNRIVLSHSGPQGSNMWRFDSNGEIDNSFDYNLNFSNYGANNWILDFAIALDNSIYIQPNTYALPNAVFKLTESGSIDTNFGTSGYLSFNDSDPNQFAVPDELLVEPGGGLIILASAFDGSANMTGKFLLRLDENGVVDPNFTTEIQPIDDNNYDLKINFHCAVLQQDGKILSMDQVAKWQNGALLGYAPLITRFNNSDGAVIDYIQPTGANDIELLVYPNPSKDRVMINGNVPTGSVCKIIDSTGKSLPDLPILNGQVDISSLPDGIYTFYIVGYDSAYLVKVVKV